jgi:CO/xanthine dehydrogenase Mo-binding subunit
MVVGGMIEALRPRMRARLESFAGAGRGRSRSGAWHVARRARTAAGGAALPQARGLEWSDDTARATPKTILVRRLLGRGRVDLDTGGQVLDVITAQDIGKAITGARGAGQIEAARCRARLGAARGMRWKDGRVWNHQLTNYIIPTSADAPRSAIVVENRIRANTVPRGGRCRGRAGPAVLAAIEHATGVALSRSRHAGACCRPFEPRAAGARR